MAFEREEVARLFHSGGLNCAESTMRFLYERGIEGLTPDMIRMMSGFGGGMQRGCICGAVVAAVAVLGLKTGRTRPGEDRAPSALAVKEFLDAFESKFGSLECDGLRRDRVSKSEEMYELCSNYVHFAVTAVEKAAGG